MLIESKGVPMRTKYLVAFFVLMLLALPSTLFADGGNGKAVDSNRVTPGDHDPFKPQNKFEVLSYAIDLWHDATLKGDDGKMKECRDDIQKFLEADIESDRNLIKMLTRQAVDGQVAKGEEGKNLIEEKPAKKLSKADQELVNELAQMIRTKELLVDGISRSEAFSNQYRLLGDYTDLLRKELDMPRLQYAMEKSNQ
jgi:hypothetical protein